MKKHLLIFTIFLVSLFAPTVVFGDHTVVSISPTSGEPGTSVVVSIGGSNFDTEGMSVELEGTAAVTPTDITATRLLVTLNLPASTGAKNITVKDSSDAHVVNFTGFNVGAAGTAASSTTTGKAPPAEFALPTKEQVPTTGKALLERIQLIGNWIFAIFLAMSLIFILIGAFQFVTAGADPAKISEARQKLIYAAVGIAIALISVGFPAILRNIVTT